MHLTLIHAVWNVFVWKTECTNPFLMKTKRAQIYSSYICALKKIQKQLHEKTHSLLLKRVYLKSGNMTNSEGFSRSANHFFAGILNVFQGKMVRRYGKRTAVWACWQFSVRPIMPHAISSSCAYRIRPRHPGMGIQQTRACVTLSLGFLPPPGAPRAALSLRKYHWYRYLSSLAFGSNPKVIRERIVARRSPDNNGNVSAVRCIQLLSMITDLQRDVNGGAWMFCK